MTTSSLASSSAPASFAFLFDAAGKQVGVEGATLAHHSVDRDVVCSVLVEEHLGGYRSELAVLDRRDLVSFTHVLDRAGPLPALTEERALDEAADVIRNAASAGPTYLVLVDSNANVVWGVRSETDVVEAASALDAEVSAGDDRGYETVYEHDLRAGRHGYRVYRVPAALAEKLGAHDQDIARIFPLAGCVAFTSGPDDEDAEPEYNANEAAIARHDDENDLVEADRAVYYAAAEAAGGNVQTSLARAIERVTLDTDEAGELLQVGDMNAVWSVTLYYRGRRWPVASVSRWIPGSDMAEDRTYEYQPDDNTPAESQSAYEPRDPVADVREAVEFAMRVREEEQDEDEDDYEGRCDSMAGAATDRDND